ncbi:MAG: PAS domain S-box protein [Terracidiphilus sp.]|jgi:PAS domain S-box-containing protein
MDPLTQVCPEPCDDENYAYHADPDPVLRDHGFLLSTLLDNSQAKIYFKDHLSRFVLVNRAMADILKLESVEDAIGKSDWDFFTFEHAAQAFADEQEIIRTGQPILDKEEKETWPDGRITWASTSKMPLRDADGGIIGTFGISHDVTETRRMREALIESEARFQELISAIREVFWIKEFGTGRILYASPAYEAIWGMPIEHLYSTPLGWLDDVHEDDRQLLIDHFKEERSEPYEITFRIRRADGELRWIRQRGFPVFDKEGNVVRFAGASADITEAREANEEFIRTQRLLASIVNSSQDAIFSESLEGVVTSWNPSAERIFGYSANEAIGRPAGLLLGPHQKQEKDWINQRIRGGLPVRALKTVRRRKDGQTVPVSLSAFPVRDETGAMIGISTSIHDLSAHKELEEKLSTVETQLRSVLETTNLQVLTLDSEWRLTYVNQPRAGMEHQENLGKTLWEYQPLLPGTVFEQEYRTAMEKQVVRRCEANLPGMKKWYDSTAFPTPEGLLILVQDVTEKHMLDEQLRSAQKMEAIGQLAAGIAHEINTPIQYIGDNTVFLKESWEQAAYLLQQAHQLQESIRAGRCDDSAWSVFDAAVQAVDLPYLRQEVPKAIEQTLEGIERVAKIVRAMKEFSHPGSEEKQAVDLNKAIEATVTIARNEWKYVADVELDLDPVLPMVVCLGGEINQVLLNLLVNAAHAIAEAQQRDGKGQGKIVISTRHDGPWAEIGIQDSGTGIPEHVREKVFDPFFTTKEVGKGTGQGLTLAQTVIVKKHSGRIWFDTEAGKGTTFHVRLPLTGEATG